jgi:hypothetical protein
VPGPHRDPNWQAAGYTGYAEVEIMNADIWDAPADETALRVRSRFADLLG